MFPIHEYEFIGKSIDLTSFQEVTNGLLYNILIDYELGIGMIGYLQIQDEYSTEDSRSIHENFYAGSFFGLLYHTHTLGDPSEITVFEATFNHYYYKDSYGVIYVGKLRQDNYGIIGSSDEVEDEYFLENGYYKITENGIYYLSNDMNLMQYLGYEVFVTVQENVTTNNWEDYIPTN